MSSPFKSQEEWNEWFISLGKTEHEQAFRRNTIDTMTRRIAHKEAMRLQSEAEKLRTAFKLMSRELSVSTMGDGITWQDINYAIEATVEAVEQGRVKL